MEGDKACIIGTSGKGHIREMVRDTRTEEGERMTREKERKVLGFMPIDCSLGH